MAEVSIVVNCSSEAICAVVCMVGMIRVVVSTLAMTVIVVVVFAGMKNVGSAVPLNVKNHKFVGVGVAF
jgi:hypothetical protein